MLSLNLPDGRAMRAYAARPDRADAPGVVVIHEVWGVERHIRSVVDRLAEAGYAAIAPDLLGMEVTLRPEVFMQAFGAIRRLPPEERAIPEKVREALMHVPEEQRDHAVELMAIAMRGATPEGLSGIASAADYLRSQGAPKVAVMGFCMGGAYVWAYAFSGGEADAFVPFYGRIPEVYDAAKVRGPLLGHYGGKDEGIPVAPLQQAAEAISARGIPARIEVYPEAPHAFFNDTRDTYRPEAAQLAWRRTLDFFRETIG